MGPALGQHGVNIMDFCKSFNAKTSAKDQEGLIIPVVITVFHDRSFTFVTKTPPASVLLKRAAGIAKGSGEPNRNKVGKVTEKQVEETTVHPHDRQALLCGEGDGSVEWSGSGIRQSGLVESDGALQHYNGTIGKNTTPREPSPCPEPSGRLPRILQGHDPAEDRLFAD